MLCNFFLKSHLTYGLLTLLFIGPLFPTPGSSLSLATPGPTSLSSVLLMHNDSLATPGPPSLNSDQLRYSDRLIYGLFGLIRPTQMTVSWLSTERGEVPKPIPSRRPVDLDDGSDDEDMPSTTGHQNSRIFRFGSRPDKPTAAPTSQTNAKAREIRERIMNAVLPQERYPTVDLVMASYERIVEERDLTWDSEEVENLDNEVGTFDNLIVFSS